MGGIKKRKALRRLERRIKAWKEEGGEYPRYSPGKEAGRGTGHIMHCPGSLKK